MISLLALVEPLSTYQSCICAGPLLFHALRTHGVWHTATQVLASQEHQAIRECKRATKTRTEVCEPARHKVARIQAHALLLKICYGRLTLKDLAMATTAHPVP